MTNRTLGIILYLVSVLIFIAMIGGTSFEVWVPIDILVIITCGLIGYTKKIGLLIGVAGAIIVGFILHFTFPLWILIDLGAIGICGYTGYRFYNDDIEDLQWE